MSKKSVLLHCNADLETGLGHFMRCLALAQEATRQNWVVYFAGNLSEIARDILAEKLPDAAVFNIGTTSVVDQLDALTIDLSPDVVHFDSYSEELREYNPKNTVLSNAQDGVYGARKATINIDANLDAEKQLKLSKSGIALFGIEYAQIRDEIHGIKHVALSTEARFLRVLVVLGGTDPTGVTPEVVRVLTKTGKQINLTVVCRESLHKKVEDVLGDDNSLVTLHSFVSDLPALANEHDFVITTASTALWDFASMGHAVGVIETADNQAEVYRAVARSGIAYPLGRAVDSDFVEKLSAAINSAFEPQMLIELASKAASVVDGFGAWRVVSAWGVLLNCPPTTQPAKDSSILSARPVKIEDAEVLLEWRNDLAARSVSRQSNVISFEDHRRWLLSGMKSPKRQLFIIENQVEPVATLRWDQHKTGMWEVSITVSPEFRGQGLSHAILLTGERELKADPRSQLIATIHEKNIASKRLFMRAGYLPFLPADNYGFEIFAKRKDR